VKDPGYGLMFLAIPRVVLLLLECAYHPAGSNLERAEMMLVELRGSHTCALRAFFSILFYSFVFLPFPFVPFLRWLSLSPSSQLVSSFSLQGPQLGGFLFIGLVGAVRARKCLLFD